MTTLTIKKLGDDAYAVEDGAGPPLTICPCCGLPFNHAAALRFVETVSQSGEPLNMRLARLLADEWMRKRQN